MNCSFCSRKRPTSSSPCAFLLPFPPAFLTPLQKRKDVPELVLQVNLAVVEVLSQYVDAQGSELNEDTGSTAFSNFLQVINVTKALLEQRSDSLFPYLRGFLHQLIEACPQPFFAETKSADAVDSLEILLFELMLLCHSPRSTVRAAAVSVLYKLLATNYARLTNIMHVKTRVTVAISSIVGKQEYDSALLFRAFDALTEYCRDKSPLGPEFAARVAEMIQGVKTLIQQTALIKENSGDPEMLAGLYHNIATGFAHSPKLRLTWLGNLQELHEKVHPLSPPPPHSPRSRTTSTLRPRSARSTRPPSSTATSSASSSCSTCPPTSRRSSSR